MVVQSHLTMTDDEYLTFERASLEKHEYRQGKVRQMPPASPAHSLIVVSAMVGLFPLVQAIGGIVYVSQLRLHIPTAQFYTYPDIGVICGKSEYSSDLRDNLLNPTILCEVYSPVTEDYDRGEKFRTYQLLPSLKEYLLIAESDYRVEHYIRQPDDQWNCITATGLNASIHLPTLGSDLPLTAIYAQIIRFGR